ncbi:hypothetical protein Emag_003173 [Eimeria magna]
MDDRLQQWRKTQGTAKCFPVWLQVLGDIHSSTYPLTSGAEAGRAGAPEADGATAEGRGRARAPSAGHSRRSQLQTVRVDTAFHCMTNRGGSKELQQQIPNNDCGRKRVQQLFRGSCAAAAERCCGRRSQREAHNSLAYLLKEEMSWRMQQHPAAIRFSHVAAPTSQGGDEKKAPLTPLRQKQQSVILKGLACWHSRSSSSTSSHGSRESSSSSSKDEGSMRGNSSRSSTSSYTSSADLMSISFGASTASAVAPATAATAAATAAVEPQAAGASAGAVRTEIRGKRDVSPALVQRLQRSRVHAAACAAATWLLLHAASRSKPPPMPLQGVTLKFMDKEIEEKYRAWRVGWMERQRPAGTSKPALLLWGFLSLLLPAAAFSWALGYTPRNAKQQQQLIWCKGYAIARLLLQLCGEALLPLLLLAPCNRARGTSTSRKRTPAPESLEAVLRHLVFVLFNLRLCLGLSDIPVQLLLLSLQQHAVEDLVLYGPFLLQLTAAALQQQQTPGQASTAGHTVLKCPFRLLLLLLLLRSGVAFAGIGSYIHGLVLRVEDACSRHVFAASVLPYLLRLEAATCCSCCATAAAKQAAAAAAAAAAAVSLSSSKSFDEQQKQQQQHRRRRPAQGEATEESDSPRMRDASGDVKQADVVAKPSAAGLAGAKRAAAAPDGRVLIASGPVSSDLPRTRDRRHRTQHTLAQGEGIRLLEHQQHLKPERQQQHKQEGLVLPQRRHSTGALNVFDRGPMQCSAELAAAPAAGAPAGEGVWSDVEPSPICGELKETIAISRRGKCSIKCSSESDEASLAAVASNAAAAATAAEDLGRGPPRYVLFESRRRGRGLQASHEHVAFAADAPAAARRDSMEGGKIKSGHSARNNSRGAAFSWRRCSGSSFSSLLQQSSNGPGVHTLHKLSGGTPPKAPIRSSRRFGSKIEFEVSQQQQQQQQQRKMPLRRLLTRLHTLNSGSRHRSTRAEQAHPAAARAGVAQAAVAADSYAAQRATPSALIRTWQRSSSNSSSNLPSWLCEGPRMAGSIAKGPRESRQMRGLRLLHHLPRWMHASSSSSSNSRLWGDTVAASPATAAVAAAAGGISPPSAAKASAAAVAAGHTSFRFSSVGSRSAAVAAARSLGDAACGNCSRCNRPEEQSPQANSGRAAAATAAPHSSRVSEPLCPRCASHRQQQVASLQQQLQLQLPPARMPTDTLATAGTKLTTPSSATGGVWICVPSSADSWRYFETHDLQQQHQQHMHQQQQQQQTLWLHRLDTANSTLAPGSPQLHKVLSMRRADSSLRSSSSLAPAAAAEGEETPPPQQRHDRAWYTRHNSRSSSNGVVQIPLPSGKPSILQEGSLLSPAAEAGPTTAAVSHEGGQSSSSSPQQQRQVTPEAAAAARAAAAAAGAEWSRKASARLRPAAEGAAAVAQRAAAAALMAAAAEVQEGHTDSPQEGRIFYSSHGVRDKLEKILWRIGV